MFPISDSLKSRGFPFVTLFIIALNIYMFLKELVAVNLDVFIANYALIPQLVDFNNPPTLYPFVTAMFLHGGFMHIISNMWFLWIFGDNIEATFGKLLYPFVYLTSGLIGNFLQYLTSTGSSIPMLGASGAVSGVLGAYYILHSHSRIKTLVPFFLFLTVIEIPAGIYLFYWFFIQLFSGVASLPLNFQSGGIAFWAHVGGFVTGVVFARIFKKREEKEYVEGEII